LAREYLDNPANAGGLVNRVMWVRVLLVDLLDMIAFDGFKLGF